nr:MAG: hypothetical protein ADFBMEEK_00019 [Peromyscus leucopus gammaherpesvirus]
MDRYRVKSPVIYGRVEKDFKRPDILKALEELKIDDTDKEAADRARRQYVCFLVAQINYGEYLATRGGLHRADHLKGLSGILGALAREAPRRPQDSSLQSDITVLSSDPKSLSDSLVSKGAGILDDQTSQDGGKSKQLKRKQ